MIRGLAGFAMLLAAAPLPAQPRHEFTELHLGVAVRLVVYSADSGAARGAARAAFDRIAALEEIFSDYRPHSEVRRLAAADTGWQPVSAELAVVLAAALHMADASDGAFDPTAGALTALWRDSRRTGRLPEPDALRRARDRADWRSLRVDSTTARVHLSRRGVALDLGGIAKGFILGQAMDVLRQRGLSRALIQAGGDLVLGDPPAGRPGWHVENAGPGTPLHNLAIATSGTGEQWVEIAGVRYAHLVDPRTGLGLTRHVEVTVIGPDPMLADALATAAALLDPPHAGALRTAFPGYRFLSRFSPEP